jgi:hypothetical protein
MGQPGADVGHRDRRDQDGHGRGPEHETDAVRRSPARSQPLSMKPRLPTSASGTPQALDVATARRTRRRGGSSRAPAGCRRRCRAPRTGRRCRRPRRQPSGAGIGPSASPPPPRAACAAPVTSRNSPNSRCSQSPGSQPAMSAPPRAPSRMPGTSSRNQPPADGAAAMVQPGGGTAGGDDGEQRGRHRLVLRPVAAEPEQRQQEQQRRHDDGAAADAEQPGQNAGDGADGGERDEGEKHTDLQRATPYGLPGRGSGCRRDGAGYAGRRDRPAAGVRALAIGHNSAPHAGAQSRATTPARFRRLVGQAARPGAPVTQSGGGHSPPSAGDLLQN